MFIAVIPDDRPLRLELRNFHQSTDGIYDVIIVKLSGCLVSAVAMQEIVLKLQNYSGNMECTKHEHGEVQYR